MFKSGGTDSFISRIYKRLLPVQIILVAIQSINGMVDGVIGSRLLGSDAMAAVGLFSPLLSLLYALACIIIVGSQVLGSQYAGKGEAKNTDRIFSITLCLITVVGIVAAMVMLIFSMPLANLLKGGKLLSDYMSGVAFSFLFDVMCAIFADYLQLMGNVKKTYFGLVALIATNVFFNVLFIQSFDMGIFGLGLATTVSTLITCIIMASGFVGEKSSVHFTLSSLPWRKTWDILKYGSSAATFNIVLALKSFALNYIVLYIGGELALGAMSVYNSILGVTGAISMGIGTTTLTIGSVFYGEGDDKAVKSVFGVSLKIGIILSLIVALGIIGLSGPMSSMFFENEPEARKILQDILILSTMYIPLNIIICVFTKMYHIRGKMTITNILSFLENALVIVVALAMGTLFGLKGVWLSLPISGLVLAIWIISYTKIKGVFTDTNAQNSLYMNICRDDNIESICKQIKSFIQDHKADMEHLDELCLYINSLMNEQIRQYNMFNCSVIYKDDDVVVRIRNNDKDSKLDIINEYYRIETQNYIGISEFRIVS